MKEETLNRVNELITRYPALESNKDNVEKALDILITSFSSGGKLLLCGNGGSAADCNHIVGVLMKSFKKKRVIDAALKRKLKNIDMAAGEYLSHTLQQGLPAISLAAHTGYMTAFSNDSSAMAVFANQVLTYGNKGDVFWALSTSGESKNVIMAAIIAKAKGLKIIGLTGQNPCTLDKYCDVSIHVPATEKYQVQEYHLPIYNAICLGLEDEFFDK